MRKGTAKKNVGGNTIFIKTERIIDIEQIQEYINDLMTD